MPKRPAHREQRDQAWRRSRSLPTWIAVLFMVGSACFAVGSVPGFASAVSDKADAIVFFVGSVFFTSAGYLQYAQSVAAGDESARFPRYLNELGVERIRIAFHAEGPARRTLSVVWTGGSQGPDRFEVLLDNVAVGLSRAVDSERRPHAWNRDDFPCSIGPGAEHVVELRSPDGFKSPIEFAGIRLAGEGAEPYQPLCYESIGPPGLAPEIGPASARTPSRQNLGLKSGSLVVRILRRDRRAPPAYEAWIGGTLREREDPCANRAPRHCRRPRRTSRHAARAGEAAALEAGQGWPDAHRIPGVAPAHVEGQCLVPPGRRRGWV